jgi:energy-coupling factor transporter transmembrane protein EcfT
MLTNITMGQYYPVDSKVHRLDPRIKLILTIAFIVAVFMAKTFAGYAILLLFVYGVARLANVPFRMLLRGLRPLRLILILTFYLLRFHHPLAVTGGAVAMCWEWPYVLLAFPPLLLYNGKRGRQNKYFFYVFYPAHLLLIYFIRLFMLAAFPG